MSGLRDYQINAINALRAEIAAGKRRVMLSSATGSGKSRIMVEMAQSAARKGRRVVVFCDRIQLVQQMSGHFSSIGLHHGILQSTNSRAEYSPVLVASIQTAAKRGLPADTDLVLIDEAHGCAGREEFRRVIEYAMRRPKTPVIGFSATPWSKGLAKYYPALDGALFESCVTTIGIPDLIEQGFLVDADVYAPHDPDLSGVKTAAGDYNERQLGEAMNKTRLVGDIVTTWLKLAHDLPTACFAVNIAHSQAICEQFKQCGIAAEHISCHTPDAERIDILKRVAAGETKVICNAMLLTTGWDFPACRCMILARPTKSLVSYVQMVGRVLRPYPGKDKALILDHSGTCQRLGMPTDDRSDIPMDDGRPKSGSDKDEKEKPEALPKPCPNCSYLKPPKTHKCPACGFESRRPSDVVIEDGDLHLVAKSKKHEARDIAERFGSKQQVYSMLMHMAIERGYQTGWTSRKYRDIFGVWPKGMRDISLPPSDMLRSWVKAESIRWAKSKKQQEESSHAAT